MTSTSNGAKSSATIFHVSAMRDSSVELGELCVGMGQHLAIHVSAMRDSSVELHVLSSPFRS